MFFKIFKKKNVLKKENSKGFEKFLCYSITFFLILKFDLF